MKEKVIFSPGSFKKKLPPVFIATDGPIKAWSASTLKKFETCPYQVFLRYVKKIPEKENTAGTRGTEIHNEAEEYVTNGGELSKNLEKFKDKFATLREDFIAGNVSCEGEWGFDKDWAPVDWKAKEVWGRAKLDAFNRHDKNSATIIDYKTGKKFGNELTHTGQGIIYAIAAFMRYPELEFIKVEFWYLDKREELNMSFTRSQAMMLWTKVHERATKLTSCTEFHPKPSFMNCRYCPYREEACEWSAAT